MEYQGWRAPRPTALELLQQMLTIRLHLDDADEAMAHCASCPARIASAAVVGAHSELRAQQTEHVCAVSGATPC